MVAEDQEPVAHQPDTRFDHDVPERLTLFNVAPDPDALRQRLLVEDSDLTRYCAAIVTDHGRRYGWSVRQRNAVIQTLRMLQTVRPTPTARIRASDVVAMRRYDGTITSTIDVLAEAELLIEDVPTRVERYFNTKFIESGALPDVMREHLELWLQIMLAGSRDAPRQIPREPETVELHIQGLAPVVQAWVEAGRRSFAEISQEDVLSALATLPAGSRRHFVENGLKSLFKILKGRRLVFVNPTKGLKATGVARNHPSRSTPT